MSVIIIIIIFGDLTGLVSRHKAIHKLIQKCDIPYFH